MVVIGIAGSDDCFLINFFSHQYPIMCPFLWQIFQCVVCFPLSLKCTFLFKILVPFSSYDDLRGNADDDLRGNADDDLRGNAV